MTNQSTERLRVLIADDESEIRELLGEYLSARGHEVHTTSDGQQALSWLKSNPVDVLLTDVQMPNITGVELVSAVHRLSVHVGVVVMTGFPTVETATTAMKMGASDYLLKPFRLREVYEAVVRAAGWGRTERELARIRRRASLYEALMLSPPDKRPEILLRQLPELLVGEVGAQSCALWLRQGGTLTAVIPPPAALSEVRPESAATSEISGDIAVIRLPGTAGVLAVQGRGLSGEELARLEHLAAVIGAMAG
jgi:FixJ family two-component response regulator